MISGTTDRADCGVLTNVAFADADNSPQVGPAEASVTVKCPVISIEKVNDRPDPVLPGTVVSYTLTVTVSDGPADDVVVTDLLPLGLQTVIVGWTVLVALLAAVGLVMQLRRPRTD